MIANQHETSFLFQLNNQLPTMATSNTSSATGKEITLPSGKKAVINPFKGKHIRQASELAGENPANVIFAMIAICCTIDGEAFVMEDLDEMEGKDVLRLQKEFSDLNF